MLKRAILSLLVLPLLAGTAAGQSDSKGKSNAAKPFTISGKVSEDGKSVVQKNGKLWLVANQAILAGYKDQEVKVKCRISSGDQEIRVLSVKALASQAKYGVHLDDSAFRR